ncbi:hypothetical protein BDQ17DRAFT_1353977 [Cyathus striatus]|nr:hypothetical protein BDQ17DRAFT_1353977 [Cyathus striatus]
MTTRDFRIQGPFGLNIALGSKSTGLISVTVPRYTSEPPPNSSYDMAIGEDFVTRSYSVATIPVYKYDQSTPAPALPARTKSNDSTDTQPDTNELETGQTETTQEGDFDMETARREPSPAPTDIHNPEPDVVARDLANRGIKARDFAHETPLQPTIKEAFDLTKSLAEFDYRTSQVPRAYPVTGKVIRRLLQEGWITNDEVQARCSPVELQLLREYDTRPQHPYYCIGNKIPLNPTQRLENKNSHAYGFFNMDKQWSQMEARRRYDEEAREEAERAFEKIQKAAREREMESTLAGMSPRSRKRALEEMKPGQSSASVDEHDTKRQRRTPESDPNTPASSQFQSQPTSSPWHQKVKLVHPGHQKQYPAPLSSYDPKLYPEAAGIIASQNRPSPPPRVDTPPLPEPPAHGGAALRRGPKRTLSRTQTFTQP